MTEIKDSGERRQFDTGAVRDICEGKGRCDLLPLQVVGELFNSYVFNEMAKFKETGDILYLKRILTGFSEELDVSLSRLILDVSLQFEGGAKKYGEYNWQKGIPVHCYVDSALRHYLKFKDGWDDEPHDRAFVWNILCCIWTMENKIELDDFCNGRAD